MGRTFIQKSYAVCTNPRSGSWLLCDGLASTSIAGNPREWFNNTEERAQRSQWDISQFSRPIYSLYIDHVRELATTPNGVLGIKLHYYQFAELPSKLSGLDEYRHLSSAELLPLLFPHLRYVWLRRRDKVRQAISYYRAHKTQAWWSVDGATATEGQGQETEIEFDPLAIERIEKVLLENDSAWEQHFKGIRACPFEIFYEDLVADYSGSIRQILSWLDIAGAKAVWIQEPRLKRQSDTRTEEWLTRYDNFKKTPDRPTVPSSGYLSSISTVELEERTNESQGKVEPVLLESPLFIKSHTPADTIPNVWKRWVGENKLRNVSDEAIINVLTAQGYSQDLAASEVKGASFDPYLVAGMKFKRQSDKAAALLGILGDLSRLRPDSNTVERRTGVSRAEFLEKYYSVNRPVILQGLLEEWPAIRLWTAEYLKSMAGNEIIEVMMDRENNRDFELTPDKHRREVPFGNYVDMVYSGKVTNDYYLVAKNRFFQRTAGRVLLNDICVFNEYLDPGSLENQVYLWFGPAGTVTPLHHDVCNIFIAQVTGRKQVKMIPPYEWAYLNNEIGFFSSVDCENPDIERYPEFRNAQVLNVNLEAGEVLFIPVGWWHQVRSLQASMTVSFTNSVFPNSYRLASNERRS